MKRLTVEIVEAVHTLLIAETGGSDGLRDLGLLESALNAPFQTFDRQYIYPTIQAKAARLGYSLVNDHPFVDGNKRIGVLVMMTFLEINGLSVQTSDDEVISLGLSLADGSMDADELLRWGFSHT